MKDPRAYRACLQGGHWFSALPAALQDALLEMAQVQRLDAGQRLFRRGDPPSGLYAVVDGAMRIGAVSASGKEALLTLIEAPYWFGEVSLFDGQPRTHDAFAEGASTLLLVPQAALLALLERQPQYWRDFALLMSQKLRLAFIALEQMSLLPAAPRLARRLLMIAENYGEGEPRRVIHLAQEQLALML
ncbi:MAG: Crp/Fnr family transcriptional regulator, partial [Pseudomonadales bacterium RIFCSPLOWO2_02_FULL_63_210]